MITKEARSVQRDTSIERKCSQNLLLSKPSKEPVGTISIKAQDDDTSLNKSLTDIIADYKLKFISENVLGRTNYQRETWEGPETAAITIDDFEVVKSLGRGKYGKVLKVRRKTNGDEFAVKLIPINTSLDQKDEDNLNSESEIFKTISNHFVVKAYYWYSFYSICKIFVIIRYL